MKEVNGTAYYELEELKKENIIGLLSRKELIKAIKSERDDAISATSKVYVCLDDNFTNQVECYIIEDDAVGGLLFWADGAFFTSSMSDEELEELTDILLCKMTIDDLKKIQDELCMSNKGIGKICGRSASIISQYKGGTNIPESVALNIRFYLEKHREWIKSRLG